MKNLKNFTSDKQLAVLTWLHVVKMYLNDMGAFAENVRCIAR